jgi:hypothetical protein
MYDLRVAGRAGIARSVRTVLLIALLAGTGFGQTPGT